MRGHLLLFTFITMLPSNAADAVFITPHSCLTTPCPTHCSPTRANLCPIRMHQLERLILGLSTDTFILPQHALTNLTTTKNSITINYRSTCSCQVAYCQLIMQLQMRPPYACCIQATSHRP